MAKTKAQIQFEADTSGFTSEIKSMNSSLTTFKKQLQLNSAEMKNNSDSVQLLAQRKKILQQELTASASKIEALRNKLQAAKETFGDNSKEVQQLNNQLIDSQTAHQKMQNELEDTDKKLDQLKNGLDDTEQELKDVDKATEKSGEGFTVFKGILADLGATAIKGALNGLKQLASGLVDVGKQAIDNYADYEQLVGGVETLFGAGGQSVEEYAKSVGKTVKQVEKEYSNLIVAEEEVLYNSAQAYKTAGMSQNEYMETVTSFSASLISSLDGDTVKAAKAADQAITDMSDNANKMGTDLSSIQNAYQGFAKQNYTMLDNLKLGYGGTKTEMERLLADAQKISGQKYDISNLNDVYEAIHVVQTEMGITGTTAKEASQTISGSISAMKSSWQNLLTSFVSGVSLDIVIKETMESAVTVAENIIPKVTEVITNFGESLPIVLKQITDKIVPLIQENLPTIISAIQSALQSIIEVLPTIVDAFATLIPDIVRMLILLLPQLISAGIQIIVSLINGITQMLPDIINAVIEIIPQLIDALINAIPLLLDAAIQLLLAIVDAIPTIIQQLMPRVPEIVRSVIDGLLGCIPDLINGAIQLLMAIVEAIPVIIQALVPEIPKIITTIIDVLMENGPVINEAMLTLLWELIKAIPTIAWELIKGAGQLIMALCDGLFQGIGKIAEPFMEIGQSCGTWINDHIIGPVKEWFGGIASWINENVVQPVVNFFQGLWDGIKKVWDGIVNAIKIAIQLIASIFDAAFQLITLPFRFIWENCKDTIMTVFNAIKNFISNTINTIKTVITTVFNAVKNTISTIWNGIKSIITTVIDGVKNIVQKGFDLVKKYIINPIMDVKNKITDFFEMIRIKIAEKINQVKQFIQLAFLVIKAKIIDPITEAKNKVVNTVTNIKDKIVNTFNNIKSKVTDIFNKVKKAITDPVEKAKNTVKGIVDKIKGFFKFNFELPKIKLPKFGITPKGWKIGDLLEGSIPKLSITWNAKGAIFKQPTIFNTKQGYQGVAEAGAEAILPLDRLEDWINSGFSAVTNNNYYANEKIDRLIEVAEQILDKPSDFYLDKQKVGEAMGETNDLISGARYNLRSRGVMI